MAMRHEKMKKKPKKSKTIAKAEHFEDTARNPFKVPKSETGELGNKS
jgi:hypothetical protein